MTDFKGLNEQFENIVNSLNEYATRKDFEDFKKSVEEFKNEYNETKEDFGELQKSYSKLKNDICQDITNVKKNCIEKNENIKNEIEEFKKEYEETKEDFGEIQKSVNKLKNKYGDSKRSSNKQFDKLKDVQEDLDNF